MKWVAEENNQQSCLQMSVIQSRASRQIDKKILFDAITQRYSYNVFGHLISFIIYMRVNKRYFH